MKFYAEQLVQRGHHYAIVDEVDSILIDEARTPLIISGASDESTDLYQKVDEVVRTLEKEKHYTVDEKGKTASLTDEGVLYVEEQLGIENLYDTANITAQHHVLQSLKAHTVFRRDVDYIVKDDGRTPVQRRPASGSRSQGTRHRRRREPDPRQHHVPELFPHV